MRQHEPNIVEHFRRYPNSRWHMAAAAIGGSEQGRGRDIAHLCDYGVLPRHNPNGSTTIGHKTSEGRPERAYPTTWNRPYSLASHDNFNWHDVGVADYMCSVVA